MSAISALESALRGGRYVSVTYLKSTRGLDTSAPSVERSTTVRTITKGSVLGGGGEIKLKKRSTRTLTAEEAEEHRKFMKNLNSKMKISTVQQKRTPQEGGSSNRTIEKDPTLTTKENKIKKIQLSTRK